MKIIIGTGWLLLAVGAFLMISTIFPFGLLLMVLGVPLVFIGVTVKAFREHLPARQTGGRNEPAVTADD